MLVGSRRQINVEEGTESFASISTVFLSYRENSRGGIFTPPPLCGIIKKTASSQRQIKQLAAGQLCFFKDINIHERTIKDTLIRERLIHTSPCAIVRRSRSGQFHAGSFTASARPTSETRLVAGRNSEGGFLRVGDSLI